MSQGLAFAPTDEQRKTVRVMFGFGIPQAEIAILLDIDPKPLRLHFRRELDRGSVEATATVAQTLYQMATSGQNTAASIFWMKARGGWREKHEMQVVGPGGGPIALDVSDVRERLAERIARLAQSIEHDPNAD